MPNNEIILAGSSTGTLLCSAIRYCKEQTEGDFGAIITDENKELYRLVTKIGVLTRLFNQATVFLKPLK